MTSNIEEGPIHICSRCNTQFSSRNKLCRHLKIAKCQSDNLLDDTSGLRLYVIGGRHRNKTLASCEYYSFAEGCWKIGPELQEHRGSHGATTVQGTSTIYTLSGGGMHGNLLSCERLHLNKSSDADCSWSFAAPMAASMPKHALAVCSFEGDESSWIYAIGGWANGKWCSSDFEVYDVGSDVWGVLPSFTIPRRLLGAVATKEHVYIFGGCIDNSNHLGFNEKEALSRDGWVTGAVERYDVEKRVWQRLRDLPLAGPASAVRVGEEIFVVIHGRSLLQYDPLDDKYTRVASLPLPQWYCFDCCSHGSRIYLTGGSVSGRWSTAFFAFDRNTLQWTQLPDMRRERRRAACAIIKSNKT